MHPGLEQHMPSFNLPSKILCKVVNVQRRVSYAMIILIYLREAFVVLVLCYKKVVSFSKSFIHLLI